MEQVMGKGGRAEGRSKIFKEFVIITVQKKKTNQRFFKIFTIIYKSI